MSMVFPRIAPDQLIIPRGVYCDERFPSHPFPDQVSCDRQSVGVRLESRTGRTWAMRISGILARATIGKTLAVLLLLLTTAPSHAADAPKPLSAEETVRTFI